MSELNTLFRKRIGYPENEPISFESLGHVLERTAKVMPFENFCILENRTRPISKENLMNKILVHKEGGLCYELNSILFLFLLENGFDAVLSTGVVFNQSTQAYYTMGRTHVTILLTHKGRTFLVDTGFGGNLPLQPVPLSGETVTSRNGEFRIQKVLSEYGDHLLEMKLKHKDTEWRIGYAFDSKIKITDIAEFDSIQQTIAEHQESSFNKHPLITKRTDNGNLTLTNTSFTQWNNGTMTKEEIDHETFKELLNQHFGRQTNLAP